MIVIVYVGITSALRFLKELVCVGCKPASTGLTSELEKIDGTMGGKEEGNEVGRVSFSDRGNVTLGSYGAGFALG